MALRKARHWLSMMKRSLPRPNAQRGRRSKRGSIITIGRSVTLPTLPKLAAACRHSSRHSPQTTPQVQRCSSSSRSSLAWNLTFKAKGLATMAWTENLSKVVNSLRRKLDDNGKPKGKPYLFYRPPGLGAGVSSRKKASPFLDFAQSERWAIAELAKMGVAAQSGNADQSHLTNDAAFEIYFAYAGPKSADPKAIRRVWEYNGADFRNRKVLRTTQAIVDQYKKNYILGVHNARNTRATGPGRKLEQLSPRTAWVRFDLNDRVYRHIKGLRNGKLQPTLDMFPLHTMPVFNVGKRPDERKQQPGDYLRKDELEKLWHYCEHELSANTPDGRPHYLHLFCLSAPLTMQRSDRHCKMLWDLVIWSPDLSAALMNFPAVFSPLGKDRQQEDFKSE